MGGLHCSVKMCFHSLSLSGKSESSGIIILKLERSSFAAPIILHRLALRGREQNLSLGKSSIYFDIILAKITLIAMSLTLLLNNLLLLPVTAGLCDLLFGVVSIESELSP